MLHPELVDFVSALSADGHYVDIITNGTLSRKFDELLGSLSPMQQEHVMVKFSFHYLELKRTNMMEQFLGNIQKVKNSKMSYSIEITPNDELVEYIDEIKNFSLSHFGALPHITVARNEATTGLELLTKYGRDEYKKIWSVFDSKLFDFKYSIFNKERCEFCYAGEWSLSVDLRTGLYRQCYGGSVLGNICDHKKINFKAIGKCRMPHCYNGHAFLAFGDIPELITPTYAEERDRVTKCGEHWLKDKLRLFFCTKLYDSNERFSDKQQMKVLRNIGLIKIQSRILGLRERLRKFRK